MDRINSVNTGLNAAGKRIRVPANAATGQAGTTGSSAYENDLQEEIIGGLIEQAGLTPTAGAQRQVYQALSLLFTQASAAITKFNSKSSNYALAPGDAGTLWYASAALTYSLPDATVNKGAVFAFMNINANPVTIATVGSTTAPTNYIIGESLAETSITLPMLYSHILLISDGGNWIVLSASPSVEAPALPPASAQQDFTLAASTTYEIQTTITSPVSGYVIAHGIMNLNGETGDGNTCNLILGGSTLSTDQTKLSQAHNGALKVTPGQSVTVQLQLQVGASPNAATCSMRLQAYVLPSK